MKNCTKCGKEIAQRNMCQSCRTTISRRNKIARLKDHYGGKCMICGYNKCLDALDFHHLETDKKEFSIREKRNASWDKLIEETKKCIMVCANCHREIHSST